MLKILHFYKTHKPQTIGGVEQFVDHTASALATQGVETRVLSLSKSPEMSPLQLNGYQAYQAKTAFEFASTPFSVDAVAQYKRHAEWADLIHLHYPYPFADLVHLMSGTKKPTLVTYHSDIVKQKLLSVAYRPLQQMFLSKVDKIVATSPNYLDTSANLSEFSDKTSIIPLGLADECQDGCNYPLSQKFAAQIEPNSYFLFVGVLRYYKGLENLVRAAKGCHFPIVVAGEGPERSALEQLARDNDISNIHFVGGVSHEEKEALLSNCRGFVFPSNQRSEAFGISLIEAAMFGKPMITCEIGTGTSYVNLGNVTGLICPHSEPRALRSAMSQLWQDDELCRQFGQNARNRFEKLFTAEKMAASYLALYRSMVGQESATEAEASVFGKHEAA